MTTHFPYQLRYVPVIVSAPADVEVLDYAEELMAACRLQEDGTLLPEDQALVDDYRLLTEPPELVDPYALIRALPENKHREDFEEILEDGASGFKDRLPRRPGEQDIECRISALERVYEGFSVGTVVYERRTNQAHVFFVILHYQIGLRSGVHRIVGVPEEYLELPPANLPHRPGDVRVMALAEASDPTLDTLKNATIGVCSTLAWALPPPWGPIAAGGMTLVQMFLGGHSGPTVGDLLAQSTQAIRDYIDANSIKGDSAKLAAFSDWMVSRVHALDKLPDQIDYEDWLPAQIRLLRDATGPNGDSLIALEDLRNYLEQPGGLDMHILSVELQLVGLKLILQFEAQIASWHHDQGDEQAMAKSTMTWLNDYGVFATAFDDDGIVSKSAAALKTAVENLRAKRLGKISPPARVFVHVMSSPGFKNLSHWCWTWSDTDEPPEHSYADTEEIQGCGFKQSKITEYKDKAVADHAKHVAEVTKKLDEKYAHVGEIITKWSAVINEWNSHLPPTKPPASPKIDPDGWKGAPPPKVQGWVEGSTVAYALAFVNSKGPGPASGYCSAVPVQADAGATLVDIPDDPLKMAGKVRILRKVRTAEGNEIVRLAAIIDVGTLTWHDSAG